MNHIPSPDTTDPGIEREIQSKGLKAPRITPADHEAAIASEHYFTAAQGVAYSGSYDHSDMRPAPLDLLTCCGLVLPNGFTVTGESACASPENFDAEMFLGDLFNLKGDHFMSSDVDAVRDQTQQAITAVLNGERWVDLPPGPSLVRRLQHEMARNAELVSHSYGKEPRRHVRIFRE